MKSIKISLVSLLLLITGSIARADVPLKPENLPAGQNMYVIERDMPGLSKLSPADLKAASQKSCKVLRDLGPQIQWVQSYVTGDKMYCVYLAPNIEIIREHAKQGGFPATAVNQVTTIISPLTATEPAAAH